MTMITPPGFDNETVNTGDVYNDVVDNLVKVLENEKRSGRLEVSEILPYDATKISSFPTICVVWSGPSRDDNLDIGRKVTIQQHVSIKIWYYHSQAIEPVARRELAHAAHQLTEALRTNADVNGYSNSGLRILQVEPINRIFQLDTLSIKAVRIDLEVPVTRKINRTIS